MMRLVLIPIVIYIISWAHLGESNTVKWKTDDGQTIPTVEITFKGEIIKIPLREAPFCRLWETHKCLCFMLRDNGNSPGWFLASFSYCENVDICGHFLNSTDYFEVTSIDIGSARGYNVTKYPPGENVTEEIVDDTEYGETDITNSSHYLKPLMETELKHFETGFIFCVFVIDPRIYEDEPKDKIEFFLQRIITDANELLYEFNLLAVYGGWKEAESEDIRNDSNVNDFIETRFSLYIDEGTHNVVFLYTPKVVYNKEGIIINGRGAYNSICSTSIGIYLRYKTKTERFSMRQLVEIFTHELGHALGLKHTQDTACNEGPPEDVHYIMNKTSSNRPGKLEWSSCSIERIQELRITYFCLKEKIKPPKPSCRNGILEEGEQCECVSKVCEKCCDNKCQLTRNSVCSTGPCCDKNTCKPKTKNERYTCRKAVDPCDIPEMCSGKSNKCPVNYVVANGYSCREYPDQEYCYNGKCGSRHDTCSWMFRNGWVGMEWCYEGNRQRGRPWGCGPTFTDHKNVPNFECKKKDKYCGKLFCAYSTRYTQEFNNAIALQRIDYGMMQHGGADICTFLLVGNNTRFLLEDPTFVQNGSACGVNDENMCVKQKCVPLPPGCPKNCHGRKVQHPDTHEWLPAYILPDPEAEPADKLEEPSTFQWFYITFAILCLIGSIALFHYNKSLLKKAEESSEMSFHERSNSSQEKINSRKSRLEEAMSGSPREEIKPKVSEVEA